MTPIKFNINIEQIFAKLSGPSKILFIVTVILVGLALMDRLMIGPYTSQMKYMEAESKAQKESIKRSKRIIAFRDSIAQEYSRYSTYLDTGEMTQEQIIAALLKKIETLAGQQSVMVTNIRPGDVEEKPIYRVYKTSIDCEGKLVNILSFINLLEQSDYLFQVERYTMGPKSKGSDIAKSTLDIARTLITAEDVDLLRTLPESQESQELQESQESKLLNEPMELSESEELNESEELSEPKELNESKELNEPKELNNAAGLKEPKELNEPKEV